MYSLCLSGKVRVKAAKNDPGMLGCPVLVQLKEVAAIMRQQNPTVGCCECEHLYVRHGCVRLAGLV